MYFCSGQTFSRYHSRDQPVKRNATSSRQFSSIIAEFGSIHLFLLQLFQKLLFVQKQTTFAHNFSHSQPKSRRSSLVKQSRPQTTSQRLKRNSNHLVFDPFYRESGVTAPENLSIHQLQKSRFGHNETYALSRQLEMIIF